MTTKKITEIGVTFYKAGGHQHDGITSSLIDTSKYSIFDFNLAVATDTSDTNREARRQANRTRFDQYVANFVTSQVLEPAGIVLPPGSVRGVNIGANEITANNIAANTITSDLLVTDFAVVNSTIRSNNFTYNPNTGVGTGWAIYSDGDAIFNNGTFAGKIDVGGFDDTSFHVDLGGNVWIGASTFVNGAVRFSSTGNTVLASGGLTANTTGAVGISGTLTVSGSTFITGDLQVTGKNINLSPANSGLVTASWISTNIFQTNSLDAVVQVGLLDARFTGGSTGQCVYTFIRTAGMNNGVAASDWNNQIIRIWDKSVSSPTSNTVSGIGFAVGSSSISATVLRAFPQAGVATNQAITSISGGTITTGTAGSGEGLDVGNAAGNGYGYIGASAFVYRSSATHKEEVEYVPPEGRYKSVERIKNLKPVRWDDSYKFTQSFLSKKFEDINERWIAKGKSPLNPQVHHFETRDHDCGIDECIGDENNRCPAADFHYNRYGLIAEDVAKVFPKAAFYDAFNNAIGIDYAVITYALIETVQDLLEKVETLESKLND